jgi:hypothetical protein
MMEWWNNGILGFKDWGHGVKVFMAWFYWPGTFFFRELFDIFE